MAAFRASDHPPTRAFGRFFPTMVRHELESRAAYLRWDLRARTIPEERAFARFHAEARAASVEYNRSRAERLRGGGSAASQA